MRATICAFIFLLGCGAAGQDAHAFTALAMRDSANAAKLVYREERKDHMRQAALTVQVRGGTVVEITTAIEAAAAEFDAEYQDLREAHAIFAEAAKRYTQLVYDRLRGEDTSTDSIVAAGRLAIDAYNRVAVILRRHGLPDMPELPEGAAEFLRVLLPEAASNQLVTAGGSS
jgi:major membrane immunogen (membrane-anchored lipoprotein)